MKKSMLLTTIAMIVIVVVALSTATFAWFTSHQSSTIKGTMTIQTGRDIFVSVWNSTASTWDLTDEIVLDQTAVAPFAPKATVGTYVAHGTTTAVGFTYNNDTNWFTATKDDGVAYSGFASYGLDDAANTDPNVTTSGLKVVAKTFQIAKASIQDPKDIKISIDLSTPGLSQNDLDAMRATKVVLVVTSYDETGAKGATAFYGTQYNYDGNDLTDSTGENLKTPDAKAVVDGVLDTADNLVENSTTVVTNLAVAEAANTEWKITSGDTGLFKNITNNISYTTGYTYEITAFIWLDGFAAVDTMAAKQVSINIGVGLAA
ncbi:MAG: hypothetical protein ACI4MI_02435 [Christensenellales bacterium]